MKLEDIPFAVTDWSKIPQTEHPAERGKAFWRTHQLRDIRIRMVEYSKNYLADHWCSRGHIVLLLEGDLSTELKDGRIFKLTPGISYQVATDAEPHRSSSVMGAKLFIVD
jgi:hypothetical protein